MKKSLNSEEFEWRSLLKEGDKIDCIKVEYEHGLKMWSKGTLS
jgi:hypothetical protein